MAIKVATKLLDGCVLGLLEREEMYGYELTKRVQESINVSNSTMYPVMRRLKTEGLVDTYDESFEGRNRRYYRITEAGKTQLTEVKEEWMTFKNGIDDLMGG
ncbi:PadR family transcriptional regulator [Lactobacillus kunkeei]|uniref:PadR family transcriptional regulator n=1 Tax=Apilactobacillus nanyangensis TaxID=2799579 RepID=A0ABT0HXC0_9LACO|nr:PadR family transcriptional regulator [Apilactobacillus nanyangensis]MBC6388542.1 PadR family transcriptional regulator [Apilactobacillus kunkeei]MCK8611571.1 PadR family transcriptional regulator [Apilactobacillus nanyangensis]